MNEIAEEKNPHKSVGFQRVIRAGFNSIHGICAALKHEAAFRQEIMLSVVLIPIALYLQLSVVEKVLLISSVFIVLMVELLNSAIEWATDYISIDTHPYAKRIKDMGSAAVFLSLLHVAVIWGLIIGSSYQ